MPKQDTILVVREKSILMQFLLQQLKGKNRDNIKSLLRNRQVWVNGQVVSQFNHELLPEHRVMIKWERSAEGLAGRDIRIVYEDEYIVVIDKQAGLLSIATGTEKEATAYSLLSTYLKSQNPGNRIFVVHRLDRDTSGLMMFAKSSTIQSLLQKTWQTNISERTYVAVVKGKVEKPQGTIRSYLYESKALMMHSTNDPAKGELAITHYRTIRTTPDYSLLEVSLETGKKNQIRVHMKELGHGIAGDRKYGTEDNPFGRLGLHANVLAFLHPVNGKPLRFTSKIPVAFLKLV